MTKGQKEAELCTDVAVKFMLSEYQSQTLINKAIANGIDPYTLLQLDEMPQLNYPRKKKPKAVEVNLDAADDLFGDAPTAEPPSAPVENKASNATPAIDKPADEGIWPTETPVETPLAAAAPQPPPVAAVPPALAIPEKKSTPPKSKPKMADNPNLVEVDGTIIDATLTLKQKIALLARAIKSNELSAVDLVRTMELHTDLTGDSAEGQTYELRVVLDTYKPAVGTSLQPLACT